MSWKETLDEILAERRQRYGGPPSLDDLVHLRDGTLSAEERERLLERASVDPEVARQLFDVLRFPEVAEVADSDVDDEEAAGDDEPEAVDRRWQAFRQKLEDEDLLSAPRRLPAKGPPRWGSLAAAFLAGIAAVLVLGRLTGLGSTPTAKPDAEQGSPTVAAGPADVATARPRVNLPLVELLPRRIDDSLPRGTPDTVVLGPEADGLVLVLSIPDLIDDPDAYPWKLLVFRETGEPEDLARIGSLEPGEGGIFVVYTPRDLWADGLHVLRLSDVTGRQGENFALWVELR